MGGWAQAIGQTAGQAGNDLGSAYDKNVKDALSLIQNKLLVSDLQNRVAQQTALQPKGVIPTPGGGQAGVTFDPVKGTFGTQPLVNGMNTASVKMQLADMGAKIDPRYKPVMDVYSGLLDQGYDPKEVLGKATEIYSHALTQPPMSKSPVPKIDGGVLLGVTDPLTNKYWTKSDFDSGAMPPEIKKVYEDSQKSMQAVQDRQDERQSRTFAQQAAMQLSTFNMAMQKGAVDEARKELAPVRTSLNKLSDSVQQDEMRYNLMKKVYQDVQKNPENIGSFDAALAAFHMGMTVGQVKGMRTGRDMVQFHLNARSLPERLQVGLENWMNGAELSPEQRQNFVELAEEKMHTDRQSLDSLKSQYGQGVQQYRDLVGGVTGGKTKFSSGTNQPSGPPAGATMKVKGSDGKWHYSDGKIDLGLAE